ncbi:craniofacial development protein 2-like [Contarinia nasturtii]|uniref:craniofacial development protein 2-like n=1 Tax=Contarinia nasturtii TaxID=265458 RepID=UPI0012D37E64|nr:craniofacial development protein 2-like [Contarinia nasturtii]XP_031639174.1 craniofacial development protein 2-like [Contarinia nasturtii]
MMDLGRGKATELVLPGTPSSPGPPPRDLTGAPQLKTALNIGTLNLRGGFESKKFELVERANDFGLDVVALSDVRVKGQIEDSLENYQVFLSGVARGRANWGVGFLIHKNLESSINCHRFVNERLMWISVKISGDIYRFVSVYSPCEGAVSERLDDFYSDLNDVIYRRGSEKVILMGDLNARVGRNDPNFANILGKFGEDSPANNNGKRLLDFCQSSGLIISNTFFKHKKIHTYSWENPGQNQKSLLDYVIIEECLRKSVMNTRVNRSFGMDSDHYLVASKLCIVKSRINSYRKPSNILRVNRLKDENVAREFVDILEAKFSDLNDNIVSDIETEWSLFKNTFLGAARECLGFVRIKNDRKKTDWWNDVIKAAVKEKRVKWIHWMQNRTEDNWTSYKEQRDIIK